MTTEFTGWLVFGFTAVGFLALCVILPFVVVLRGGRFWRGVLIGWLASAAYSLAGVLIAEYIRLHVMIGLSDYCFEGPHFVAFAITGWWNGIIVCTPALIIRKRRERLGKGESNVAITPPSQPADELGGGN